MDSPVAIVTGGARGIGAAICRALLRKGYKVCIADILEENGRQFADQQRCIYGSDSVLFSKCDVTDEEDYERTFKLALKAFHRIDVLVNNAGIYLEQDQQDQKKTIEVNLIGPIYGCQTALRYMGKSNGGKGGVVINTASTLGFLPLDAGPAYSASKHGVIGLTRSYGQPYHLEKDGIIFAAVCPSHTDTDLLKTDKRLISGMVDKAKSLQLMSPDYVSGGYLKILEDKINGSTLVVNKHGFQYIEQPEIDK